MSDLDFDSLVDTVRAIVEEVRPTTLSHFRADLSIEHKEDESPVTIADRSAKLTCAAVAPSSPASAVSTRPAQAAQCMPVIASSTCSVRGGYPAASNACAIVAASAPSRRTRAV